MPEIDTGLIDYFDAPKKPQESEKLNIQEGTGEEEKEEQEAETDKTGTPNIMEEQVFASPSNENVQKDLIIQVMNLPSFTYAISEDLVIPPVLDTDFALHRDKVQKIMRSYDYYVDLYNSSYEQFFDILNAERNQARIE